MRSHWELARLQSMAISCATQSANELCKYYRGPQSLSATAGRLRHNGHGLQVADIIIVAAERQTVTTSTCAHIQNGKTLLLFTEYHETANLRERLSWGDGFLLITAGAKWFYQKKRKKRNCYVQKYVSWLTEFLKQASLKCFPDNHTFLPERSPSARLT